MTGRQRLIFGIVAASCCAGWAGAARGQEPIIVDSVLLKLVERVDVPAEQAGVLREVTVKAGDLVATGDRVAQIDDAAARVTALRAAVDVQMAERLARDRIAVEIALKTAEQARQKLQELRLQEQMAARQAQNEFKVQAAEKARAVAENELQRARRAKERFDDAVSQSEIDGRRLESEKAGLEALQSQFERTIDGLRLDVATEALRGQELAVGAADLETSEAEAQQEVAQLQAQLKRHELELARLELDRRRLTSPLDGVVVEIYRQPGEWVEPGEPVIRILRLNRLWVEGFIRVDDLSKCVEKSRVQVQVPIDAEESLSVEGEVVYVGREVDPVNREVLLRAEIPNPDLRLLPGMSGRMLVLGRAAVTQAGFQAAPQTVEPQADSGSPTPPDAAATPAAATPAAAPGVAAAQPASSAVQPASGGGSWTSRFDTVIDADFDDPLRIVVAKIALLGNLTIEIDAAALKDAGLTMNMRQQFRLGRRKVREALQAIVEKNSPPSPGQRLCICVDDAAMTATLTTESFARQQGRAVFPLVPRP